MKALDVARCGQQLLWLLRTRRWRRERIRAYQRAALAATLEHAVRTVPHYRDLGLVASGADPEAALRALPILTKRDVQLAANRLLCAELDPRSLHRSRSSGSTGEPTTTYFDRDAWLLTKYALKLRRILLDLGRPPYRVLVVGEDDAESVRVPSRHALAAAMRLSIRSGVDAHLDAIARFHPSALYGTPSWLQELAHRAHAARASLPRVRIAWTSSEVLTPRARAEIESAFGCAVRDVYGSTEFKELAVECRYGRRHLNFESAYVEVLPAAHGEGGALLITSLVNRAMPLIRYRVGDVGELIEGTCECGNAAPWLERIGGREVDLLELPGGGVLSPYALSTLMETHAEIARYRFVLHAPDGLEVLYQTKRDDSVVDVERMQRDLEQALRQSLSVVLRRVDRFERTPAGKHAVLIRSVE